MKFHTIARRGATLALLGAVSVVAMTFLTLDGDAPSGSIDTCLNGTSKLACGNVR